MAEPIDPLETIQFSAVDGGQQQNPEAAAAAAAQAQQEAQALQALEAGVARVVYFGLKAVRSMIARRMPEILDDWTDPVLQGPAEAAVPLLRKHMERLSEVAGANPELTVFFFACVPLGMGYISASERHARTVEDAKPKDSTAVMPEVQS